jgi:hypothetical protein
MTDPTEGPSPTLVGMTLIHRAAGLALCMFRDAHEEPCGSANEALRLLCLGHNWIARGAIHTGLAAHDKADRLLANVHYLTPDGVHGS